MRLPGANFNRRLILFTVSTIMLIEALAMIPSIMLSIYDGDEDALFGLAHSAVILFIFGMIGRFYTRKHINKIKSQESYYVVLICWISAVVGGMLPFLLMRNGHGIINSLFESSASWTTSNAWVIDIDAMPRSIVFWKATTNWLGGMGIIILTIIVFTALGAGGQKLAVVEIGGPKLDKQTARITDTARLLYLVYGGGTVIEVILLKLAGLPLFDSIINAMSTISTSGTMDYNGVLSQHFTTSVKVIIVVFSILASFNFAIYIKIIKHRSKETVIDFEMKLFLIIIGLSVLATAIMLYINGYYHNIGELILNSSVGVVSFSCTTGFSLEHVEFWPSACKFLFVILMIIGGCSNSTCGGIKVIRFAVYVKLIGRGIYKRIHPRAVKPIMIKDEAVSTESATSISTFIMLFLGVYLFSTLLFSLENMDMETTLTAPIALYTNTGTGFGILSGGDFSAFSGLGRFYGALLMMLGRLEMYAILILFTRSFWMPNRTK